MNKVYLIAGGLGFIGRNFCKRIAKDPNNKIIIIDNMLSSNFSGLSDFSQFNNILFYQESISCDNFVMYVDCLLHDNKINKIDEIWNFACVASPKGYRNHSFEVIDACTKGVKNLCELTYKYRSKLYHTSTSEVYGDTKEPMVETNRGYVNCFGPRSCYDEGKRMAETIIYEYIVNYDIDAYIYRLFNTFGPGMMIDDGRVISNFIVKALYKQPLEIYGAAEKMRTFCYVDETIDKMLLAAANIETRHPINIGSDKNLYSLIKLAYTILDLIYPSLSNREKYSLVKTVAPPVDDPFTRIPVIDNLISKLNDVGEKPIEVSFIDGLQLTIDYFRNILKDVTLNELLERYTFDTYTTKQFL